MQLRPSARVLCAAAVIALASVLSSCGFDLATDRVYTPGAGVNDRDEMVDVLAAVVISGQEGSGTFIASFANNDQVKSATVTSIAGTGDDQDIAATDFTPITVPAGGLVNLADDDRGVVLTGKQVVSGEFVELSVGFGDGTSVEVDVPVYPPCGEYAGLDKSGDGATAEQDCTVETPAGE